MDVLPFTPLAICCGAGAAAASYDRELLAPPDFALPFVLAFDDVQQAPISKILIVGKWLI